jgi:hypothetical protein
MTVTTLTLLVYNVIMEKKRSLSSSKINTSFCKKPKTDDSSSLANDPNQRTLDAAIRDAASVSITKKERPDSLEMGVTGD